MSDPFYYIEHVNASGIKMGELGCRCDQDPQEHIARFCPNDRILRIELVTWDEYVLKYQNKPIVDSDAPAQLGLFDGIDE